MIDYHIHPGYSLDAEGTLEDYLKVAVTLGYEEIGFTPHLELDPKRKEKDDYVRLKGKIVSMRDDWLEHYFEEIDKVKRKFKGIKIRAGIEIGYEQEVEGEIRRVIARYPFDYVLGAVHSLNHISITETKEKDELARYFKNSDDFVAEYFSVLEKAVRSKLFNFIAHFDIYKKVGFYLFGKEIKNKGMKKARKVLCLLKSMETGLEINTGGLRQPFKEVYPAEEIIKLAQKIGIRNWVLGSDTHFIKDFGDYIHWGMAILKKNGLSLYKFDKRKRL